MYLTSHTKILGIRCNQYLRRALPPDSPVKRLAVVLGQSRQTAARLFAGDPPTSAQLTALAAHFGKDFLAYVFEPVVGDMSDVATDVTLSRVEELLLSLRRPVRADASQAAPARPEAAAVSTRLPLSDVARHPGLLPSLERFRERAGRWELSQAVAMARADGEGGISVNGRRRGDVLRFAYRGRASLIHPPNEAIRGRPVSSLADTAYMQVIMKGCEEAAQSDEPVLTRNRGFTSRSDGARVFVDAVVLRVADRAKDGTLIFTSHFVPAVAA